MEAARISPLNLNQSDDTVKEPAKILAGLKGQVKKISQDLNKSLPKTENNLRDLTAFTQMTEFRTLNENLKYMSEDLKTYVVQGATPVEIKERVRVGNLLMNAFLSSSPVLALNFKSISALPESIRLLKNLELLDLSECESLKSLPDVLDCFPRLLKLNLQGCKAMRCLPRSVLAARWFTTVFMTGSGIDLSDPTGVRLKNEKTTGGN